MQTSGIPYFTYLLRFWPEENQTGEVVWCFTLLDPHSGQRLGFRSVDELSRCLTVLTESQHSLDDPFEDPEALDIPDNKEIE